VELLIKYEANLNAQDREGRTPLHTGVMRMCAEMKQMLFVEADEEIDPSSQEDADLIYEEYKAIIKELLFCGADRNIKTKKGQTALDILNEFEDTLTKQQMKSMRFILTDQTTCVCFMRHRPIKKMRKSTLVLVFAILWNMAMTYLFYGTLETTLVKAGKNNDGILLPFVHDFFVAMSLIWFCIALPTFVMAASLQPGYLEKIYDYILLVRTFIEKELDMDMLCTYCECIKSETSFHCMMCGQCVEMFDHHCPFLNNCLGFRNYKFFLVFIVSYFLFLCFGLGELIRRQLDLAVDAGNGGFWKMSGLTWAVGIMFALPLPIIFFQVSSQCGSLCRKRKIKIKLATD